ncbi:hypothetical protein A2767_01240 [Candidatus Roizmanbacteria bacterium RIFCSPHIGHO2_01_FULL_35_10]|uniref:Uncharacterized protein n=1 Tax=Candidatus Roizmanbacteria bacterium RIFCSPLOWO2_01_FULL_35_13 TaxID=1802055 RepID=A0A1F7I7P1_9BACT|nr:MAG: hypothetical protein A2767_01240 [Candidatus Roizmanbacteria bacterium RIFCSPHIGHO2_01_FULL_35_10]OGK39387.1 MAG: hypothetical protein A3A74_06145 [Candidatus Roizmanbacteria bacterium RIFCSPLOWO2_01_FULL_35_13]
MNKKILRVLFTFILAILIFFLLLKKPATQLYCWRKINIKIDNVKEAAYYLGVIPLPEEDDYINSIKNNLYQQCLNNKN